jgi:hypothetical protein
LTLEGTGVGGTPCSCGWSERVGGKGVKHEYVRVVEAYREHGKTRHCRVLNLGCRDLLAAHLDLNELARPVDGIFQTAVLQGNTFGAQSTVFVSALLGFVGNNFVVEPTGASTHLRRDDCNPRSRHCRRGHKLW